MLIHAIHIICVITGQKSQGKNLKPGRALSRMTGMNVRKAEKRSASCALWVSAV
jgi:hypothetical protein